MSNAEIESTQPRGTSPTPDQAPASWTETLAGVALFLVIGALFILEEVPVDWIAPEKIPFRTALIWAAVLLPPLGVAAGWMRDFPRWSYAYIGAVLISHYLASSYRPYLSLFGIPMFGVELPGERAWIPLLFFCGIALLVTRSFHPLSVLVSRVNRDLTLVTYTFVGLLPIWIAVSFDEIDRLYSLPWVTSLMVLMAGASMVYLRSRNHRQRVISLSAGVLLSLVLMAVGPTLYQPEWVNVPYMIFVQVLIATVLLVPAFFSLAQQAVQAGKV